MLYFILIFPKLLFQHVFTINSDSDPLEGYAIVHECLPLEATTKCGDPQGDTPTASG